VEKRDDRSGRPGTRFRIDQIEAQGSQSIHLSLDVRDLVTDVVEARATLSEEFTDGGVVANRGEKLDEGVVAADEAEFQTPLLKPFGRLYLSVPGSLVIEAGSFQILYDDPDVMYV
jgi:hypothetical protein